MEEAKKRELISNPIITANVCKRIPETSVNTHISRKIELIEKSKDSVEELKEQRQKVCTHNILKESYT